MSLFIYQEIDIAVQVQDDVCIKSAVIFNTSAYHDAVFRFDKEKAHEVFKYVVTRIHHCIINA